MIKDYYAELEVNQLSTNDEIKKSFRRLIHKWHPDKNNDVNAKDKTASLIEAYEVLSNPRKRIEYDQLYNEFLKKSTSLSKQVIIEDEFENWRSDVKEKAKAYSNKPFKSILSDILEETFFHIESLFMLGLYLLMLVSSFVSAFWTLFFYDPPRFWEKIAGFLVVCLIAYWIYDTFKRELKEYREHT